MKKLLIIMMLGLMLVGCGSKNVIENNEVSVNETSQNSIETSKEDVDVSKSKKEEFSVETGMLSNLYLEIPVKDPANKDVTVETHGISGGMAIAFLDYTILHGVVTEVQAELYGAEYEHVEKTEDLMDAIEPQMLNIYRSYHIINGEIPYDIEEKTLDSSELVEIGGCEFNVVKGVMNFDMVGPEFVDIYFYGYITRVDGYPNYFIITEQSEEARDKSMSVLDDIMSTFKKKEDVE